MLTPRQPHEIFRNTSSPYRIGYKNGKYRVFQKELYNFESV
jgi:hypothetical protein